MKARRNLSERSIVEAVIRYVGRDVAVTEDFSNDVGLDSLDRLNLMATVEQALGVQLSDEDIASISSLQDLLSLLDAEPGESGTETGGKWRRSQPPSSDPNPT